MERKLRWGVIGAAGINQAVVPAIQASSTGSVVAIASRDLNKAQAAAEKFNIPTAYGSYEEILLDSQIDAIYIPLPNHLHKEWAIRAAQAGKHVLCEKPLALNAEEAQEMVDASNKAGVKLAEAFMHRHNPRLARIKAIIASGEIGHIRGLHGTFTFNNAQDKTNVRVKAEWGGGSVYDVGCYPISLARLIMGSEPVAATAQAFFSEEHDGVDMMTSGLIEFPDHVALTFDCGMWADFRQTFEILGTEGRIELPQAFLPGPDNIDFVVIAKGERREEKVDFQNPYTLQADNFARAIFGEEPLLFEAQDAYGGYIQKTKAGVPNNAVNGFVKYLWNAVKAFSPTHVVCCWDMGSRTFRTDLFELYKGNRGAAPEELIPQFEMVKDVVAAFNIPNIGLIGYEADDCIGTLSAQFSQHANVTILTGDHDMLQLVSEQIKVVIMLKGQSNYAVHTLESLFLEKKLTPAQVVDLKGLIGDTADNYPGVRGIGEKTALKLLQEYASIELILENLALLPLKNKAENRSGFGHAPSFSGFSAYSL